MHSQTRANDVTTLINRIAHSIATDLKKSGGFPSDYHDFLDRVDALIPKALHGMAPDDATLLDVWVDAGHPGSDLPTSIPMILAIRNRLVNHIAANLDPWIILDDFTGALSDTVRQDIAAATAGDRKFYFDLLTAYLRS